jgi:hypothetical protein
MKNKVKPLPFTKIILEIDACNNGCPHCGEKITKGYGYAMDYFCKLKNNKVVSGYVEWESDLNPVPDWCPVRVDKDVMEKIEQERIMGDGI